jgi:transcriptional regulator with XRE-family HTH domain
MTETRTRVGGLTREAQRRYILNEPAFRERCAALGAHTDQECCKVAGISRATLNRWRHGVINPSIPLMHEMSKRLGAPRERLLPEVIA